MSPKDDVYQKIEKEDIKEDYIINMEVREENKDMGM